MLAHPCNLNVGRVNLILGRNYANARVQYALSSKFCETPSQVLHTLLVDHKRTKDQLGWFCSSSLQVLPGRIHLLRRRTLLCSLLEHLPKTHQ